MSWWLEGVFTAITAATGQTWTMTAFVALLSGSLGATTASIQIAEFNGSSVFQDGSAASFTPSAALARYAHTRTLVTAISPLHVNGALLFSIPNGATLSNAVIRIALPQIEEGGFESSPILPPIGVPGVTTRFSDILTGPLSSLGISANGNCTLVGTFMLPQAAVGTNGALMQIDGGSDGNRYIIFNPAGTNTLVGHATVAFTPVIGGARSFTPGTPFKVAMCVNNGRFSYSVDGGTVEVVTGGLTSGFNTLRLFNVVNVDRPSFGYTTRLSYLPRPIADADLQALSLRGG
jgi:hypothetical protein